MKKADLIALAAAGLLFAATALRLLLPGTPAATRTSAPDLAGTVPSADAALTPDQLREAAAHNLFSADRSGSPEARAMAGSPAVAGLTLTGVVISGGLRAVSLQLADGTSKTVALGGVIGGWTVAEVEADHIVLRQGATQNTLSLKRIPTSSPPPTRTE